MGEISDGVVVVVVVLFLFVLAILWFLLPFAIFGTKDKLSELIAETKKALLIYECRIKVWIFSIKPIVLTKSYHSVPSLTTKIVTLVNNYFSNFYYYIFLVMGEISDGVVVVAVVLFYLFLLFYGFCYHLRFLEQKIN
jgi:hypothetical protein